MRLCNLTEHRPSTVRLSSADLEFFLESYCPPLRILPTGSKGDYRITSLGAVGMIQAPRTTLVIRPKIPASSFLHMLGISPRSGEVDETIGLQLPEMLLRPLASRFAELLFERVRLGLCRGYEDRIDTLGTVRGKLDVIEHLRAGQQPAGLPCEFDELSCNLPCNQIPRTVAEGLVSNPLVDQYTKSLLGSALRGLESVHSISEQEAKSALSSLQRVPLGYEELLSLSRLLLECRLSGASFLLNMERAFERYVANGLERHLGNRNQVQVLQQPLLVAGHRESPGPSLEMRPDIVLRKRGRALVVADVKWKTCKCSRVRRSDAYQVLAYAGLLGAPVAMLVYPGRRDDRCHYELRGRTKFLAVHQLKVTGEPVACRKALEHLMREMVNLAREARSA